MSTLRLIFLFLGFLPLFARAAPLDNILLNGNFNVGKIHWQGDGVVTPAGGSVFLRLNRDRWTVLSQQITTGASSLELKVLYSVSPFCSLGKDLATKPLTAEEIKTATGLSTTIPNLTPGRNDAWIVLFLKNGHIVHQAPVSLNLDEDNPHTFTTTFSVGSQSLVGENLCLAFPPGKGMVTISNMELLKQR